MRTIAALYVDNAEATPATSTRSGAVFNPATGEAATVGFASADDTSAAVASAAKAFPAWRDTSLAKRPSLATAWDVPLFLTLNRVRGAEERAREREDR